MHASSRLAAGCVALVAGMALAACSSGGSSATTGTTAPADAHVEAKAGAVDVASAGGPVTLADADRDAVLAAVSGYVQDATVAPIEGKAAPDLAGRFTAATAPALQGAQRDALVDTGVPRATGKVTATLAPVALRGLADPNGAIDLVGATLDATVTTTAAGGPVTVHRTGELMFTRDGGAWKILGFTLAVTRDGAGLGAATSTTSKAPA
jgi:hypothetical protein